MRLNFGKADLFEIPHFPFLSVLLSLSFVGLWFVHYILLGINLYGFCRYDCFGLAHRLDLKLSIIGLLKHSD